MSFRPRWCHYWQDPALARARAGDGEAFGELTEPYRRELQLHCYRILGSVQDAEDMLQETLLAAWRGLDRFEERTSVRTWLYKIATNRCLNARRDSGRRPRPPAVSSVAGDTAGSGLPSRSRDRVPAPRSPRERAVVRRFVGAFEAADIDRLVDVLTDDARLTMPPGPLEYRGHAAIAQFYLSRTWWGMRAGTLVPTRANGQPAFGYYLRDARLPLAHASGLVVLTLAGDKISAITRFGDNSLFPHYGLPRTLRD